MYLLLAVLDLQYWLSLVVLSWGYSGCSAQASLVVEYRLQGVWASVAVAFRL